MSIDYDNPYISMRYSTLLEKLDKNDELPSKDIIAYIIAHTKPEFLTLKKVSFEEHIWYMFQYECNIHNHFENGSTYWAKRFLELIKDGFLDKERFLQETLLTTTRFSNRSIPNYFFRILEHIDFDNTTLLNQQNNLFLVLQSPHSKPINQTLKYIKRIYKEPNFDIDSFMEQIPLLLSWSVKSIVNATLSLIDLLIKAYPAYKESLALLATQALAQTDESLQSKTIKLLAKHKWLENQTILDEISIYSDGLYSSTKAMLPDIQQPDSKSKDIEIIPPKHIREDNRIIYPESFEDMVFFFSQVFEGNNVYDFDLFLYLIPKLNRQINKNNVDKLSPAFDRAYKSYIKLEHNNYSDITFAMISFFIHYAQYLIKKFPENTKNIQKSQLSLDNFFNRLKKERENEYQCIIDGKYYVQNTNNPVRERHLQRLKDEPCYGHICLIDFKDIQPNQNILYLYHKRLQSIWNEIMTPQGLSILSTPTHTPAFIELSIFIDRITNAKKFENIDMQIALNRVIASTNPSTEHNIDNEIGDILHYLFGNKKFEINLVKTPEYWQIAILRKGNQKDALTFTKAFYPDNPKYNILNRTQWHFTTKTSFHVRYNDYGYFSHYIKYQYPNQIRFKHKLTLLKSNFDSIFKYNSLKNISSSDIPYLLLCYPTMPHYIFDAIEYPNREYNYDTEPERVKYNLTMLQLLNDIWLIDNHEITYLFVARSLIDENKSIRTLASELWYKATTEGTMNHHLLGKTLGKLEHNEYAPLKRFTDLLVSDMLNISPLHNQGLHTLLSAMIAHMSDEPIKGVKKLLEIYLEVLSLTNLEIPQETCTKLDVWSEVKSLRSVVKKINSRR